MSRTNPKKRGGGGIDFFETPGWVTRLILPHVLPSSGVVLDPCAGRGAILAEVLAARMVGGYSSKLSVMAIEKESSFYPDLFSSVHGPIYVADAFEHSWRGPDDTPPDLVLMNPPFVHALAFVKTALERVASGGTVAALLRAGFCETEERAQFLTEHPADLFVLPNRPGFTSDGGKDSALYAWFVWGTARGGRWTVLPTTPKDVRCPPKPRKPRKPRVPRAPSAT